MSKDRPDREKILKLIRSVVDDDYECESTTDEIIALKPTWTESVGWLIDRGWVPPDQYEINIEEIKAKARLTVQTELALERDIIKQINEAKIEEAKREERERITRLLMGIHPTCEAHIYYQRALLKALKGD